MWRRTHTALVILLLALPCSGQFSEIWTNGDYFAVNAMASQCHSASVERCVAVGVTPNEPSYFDYLLGKNHAKLASVKANISAVRKYFAPINSDTTSNVNACADNPYLLAFQSDADFLAYCSLPSTSMENPYFKTQYAGTTGGWHSAWRMLTNLTKAVEVGIDLGRTNGFLTTWINASSNTTAVFGSYDIEYSLTQGTSNAVKQAGYRYWYPNSDYSYLNPESFEFKGSIYALSVTPMGYSTSFDTQGDNVSTNYMNYLTWTNAIGGISPKFMVAADQFSRPPNFTTYPQVVGYYFDTYMSYTVCFYDFIATTNGFKYR